MSRCTLQCICAQAYAAARLWKPREEVGGRIDAILGVQVVGDAVEQDDAKGETKVRGYVRMCV